MTENKMKLVKKNGFIKLVIKSAKGQQLDEREIYSINNMEIPGLLCVYVAKKGNGFKLTYDFSGFVSLTDYLKTPLTRVVFSRILQNMFDTMRNMQNAYFRQQNLLLNYDYVMINPATQRVHFVYLPIQLYQNSVQLRDFLLNIIQICTFAQNEDTSYVKRYINILNDGINFSVFELEQYVKTLDVLEEAPKFKKCSKCNAEVTTESNFCPVCGYNMTGNAINKNKIYDPSDTEKTTLRVESGKNNTYVGNSVDINHTFEKKGNTQNFTTVLGESSGGTSVLGVGALNAQSYPYLIREKNQEKITLNRSRFRIGKEESCDYTVNDNTAVSRKHAEIITKDNRYFIVDIRSTNGTFVDERIIPIEKEMEIFNNTKIKLADEEFTFYLG